MGPKGRGIKENLTLEGRHTGSVHGMNADHEQGERGAIGAVDRVVDAHCCFGRVDNRFAVRRYNGPDIGRRHS